jgi:enamine deaminase RidA (YjgF/YER057c/UK114 family)
MDRQTTNPWTWQDGMGYAQGVLVTGAQRTHYVAGQGSIGPDGAPLHAGDMAAQAAQVMDNVEAVLAEADLTLADVVRYDVHTTDLAAYFEHGAGVVAGRLAATGHLPAGGIAAQVVALAMPHMLVEVSVIACA